VYLSIDGVLKAVVKKQNSIARILKMGVFYIDYEGDKMPLSIILQLEFPCLGRDK
jgi:hypothetical protein